MRRDRALFAIALLSPFLSAAADWTVYLHRTGPVQIGMSLAAVRQALGDPTARLKGNTPEVPLNECAYLVSTHIPEGLGFMFAEGRVVRIDVSNVGFRTASGVGIGDTEDLVKQRYSGQITVEPNHYVTEGHYLNYSPVSADERRYGMVFETDGAKVTAFRAGTLAAIALAEGCS